MISLALALSEVQSAKLVLSQWEGVLTGERTVEGFGHPGIPREHFPGNEDDKRDVLSQMASELVVVAGKCETLAEVLLNSR